QYPVLYASISNSSRRANKFQRVDEEQRCCVGLSVRGRLERKLLVEGLQAITYKPIEAFRSCFTGMSSSVFFQLLKLKQSSNHSTHAGGIYLSVLFPGATVEILPVPDCRKICREQIVQVALILTQPKLCVAGGQAEPQPNHIGKRVILGVRPALIKFLQGLRIEANVRALLNILSQFGVIDDRFHFMGLGLQESR